MDTSKLPVQEWLKRFPDDTACQHELIRLRWPDGFQCLNCNNDRASFLKTRNVYECTRCHSQISVIAGTVFHSTKIPLFKWFLSVYWVSVNKHISGSQLAQYIGVSRVTACKMLSKLLKIMKHKDSLFYLNGDINLDQVLLSR